MARRLVAVTARHTIATAGPHLYPATANVRFTEGIRVQRSPDPPRSGDFNTRPSRRKFYHGGNSLSLFILREGFERSHVRAGVPRQVGLSHGRMLPVRNPVGNSAPFTRLSWGTLLDRYNGYAE